MRRAKFRNSRTGNEYSKALGASESRQSLILGLLPPLLVADAEVGNRDNVKKRRSQGVVCAVCLGLDLFAKSDGCFIVGRRGCMHDVHIHLDRFDCWGFPLGWPALNLWVRLLLLDLCLPPQMRRGLRGGWGLIERRLRVGG